MSEEKQVEAERSASLQCGSQNHDGCLVSWCVCDCHFGFGDPEEEIVPEDGAAGNAE